MKYDVIRSYWPAPIYSDGSTLNLDFTTGVLDSRLTFTRAAGTATYINSSGYVTTAAANTPRFDYDPVTLAPRGLLVEGNVTNFITQSQALSGYSNYGMIAISVDGTVTDPMGGTNTKKIAASATTGGHQWMRFTTASTATTVTASIFAKKNNYKYLYLSEGTTNTAAARFNLETGVVDNTMGTGFVSASATPHGNGWWRCRITQNITAGSNRGWSFAGAPDSGVTYSVNSASYTGTGNADDGIYAIGWQVEEGSGASSYIPTVASQVTRNPDQCYIYDATTSGGLSWFKTATQGTIYVEAYKRTAGTSFAGALHGTRATSTQDFMLYQAIGNNWLSLNWGASEYVTNYSALSSPFLIKSAVAFSPGSPTTKADSTVSINGSNSALSTAPNIALPFASDLFCIGSRGSAGGVAPTQNYADTAIRRIKFYPVAMTAAQMNTLTTL